MVKKRAAKVSVRLEGELLDVVDDEVKRIKTTSSTSRPTRATAVLSLVQKYTHNLQPDDSKATYEQFLKQASVFKLKSLKREAFEETESPRGTFLRAAAFELLALSVLEDPPDSTIIRHLIEIVECVKKGTGYKSLPDARQGAKLMATSGNA